MKQSKYARRATVNNRKRTKGRKIQTVPIFDRYYKVVDHKQITHRPAKSE